MCIPVFDMDGDGEDMDGISAIAGGKFLRDKYYLLKLVGAGGRIGL
jgi:hypothetical protein